MPSSLLGSSVVLEGYADPHFDLQLGLPGPAGPRTHRSLGAAFLASAPARLGKQEEPSCLAGSTTSPASILDSSTSPPPSLLAGHCSSHPSSSPFCSSSSSSSSSSSLFSSSFYSFSSSSPSPSSSSRLPSSTLATATQYTTATADLEALGEDSHRSSRASRGAGARFTEFLATSAAASAPARRPNRSILDQRSMHNYYVDRGLKFNISYRTPTIAASDIFDLEKFGCHKRAPSKKKFLRTLSRVMSGASRGKDWWHHPAIKFGNQWGRIGVHLQDLTSGEVKWDAVYDLQPAPHQRGTAAQMEALNGAPLETASKAEKKQASANAKKQAAKAEDDPPEPPPDMSGTLLSNNAKPVGGSHPFFAPDWCPAPNDGYAHRYRLTIKNLSQFLMPEQETVGEMLFTEYGPSQLDNTYAYEETFGAPAPANM